METAIDEPPSQIFLLSIIEQHGLFLTTSGIAMFLLLILSALISGSEVAFFSLSVQDITNCRDSSHNSDKRIYNLILHPRLLLATILIFNNFVNVGMVTLSTLTMWRLTGSTETSTMVTYLTPIIITFLIVFFGEVMPKVYAIQNNLILARFTSGMLKSAQFLFRPLSYILLSTSSIIERRIEQKGYEVSVDELNKALELTTATSETTEEEKDILKGIVNFGSLTARQIMKSRMDITAFEDDLDWHSLMDKINKSGFSRIPIFTETIDNIRGILYVKDLLPYTSKSETFEWQRLVRQGYFIPETKKIDTLLKDFQEKRVHMAIVVDEYGGTAGLVTLEDVIEEIIGEINDEFDDEDIIYNKLDKNTFVFEGRTSLTDFCKIISVPSTTFDEIKGESESLGGLVLEMYGTLPKSGEQKEFNKFIFTVEAVDLKRIKRVRVHIND